MQKQDIRVESRQRRAPRLLAARHVGFISRGRLPIVTAMLQANTISKPRLLILDEDRIILQSLSQFLRRDGYEVKTTDRANDAMAILDGGQTELLLADINMPGIKPADFL